MDIKEIIEQLPPRAKMKSMSAYDKLILEGKIVGLKEGKTIEKFRQGIQFVLVAVTKKDYFTDAEITEFSDISIVLINQIRDSFKERKIIKANNAILKAFQKITPLNKEEKAEMRKMVKKYYLRYTKTEEDDVK